MSKALTKEQFITAHSAYFQQIGFDVQFAGCMYYLLGLGLEDRLDYEREDDFVIHRKERGKEITEYYQVKHTVATGSNMTDSDSDFWKTIDNWVTLYDRCDDAEKQIYFTQGRFVILTNKSPKNFLYTLIEQLKDGTIEIDTILSSIDAKLKETPSFSAELNHLKSLSKSTINQFLHKVTVHYFEDFIQDMYEHFLDLYQGASKSDQIVKNLIGELFAYKKDCNGKFSFTGSSFKQQYKHILQLVTDEDLTLEGYDAEGFDPALDYQNLPMVQQLDCIKVIEDPSDASGFDLSNYLKKFYRFLNAFHSFQRTQLMTSALEDRINEAASSKWLNIFNRDTAKIKNKSRRGDKISEEEKVDAGQTVFYNVMNENIPLSNKKTDQDFSNGWFLRMSNLLKVVWHFDWYKKHINP